MTSSCIHKHIFSYTAALIVLIAATIACAPRSVSVRAGAAEQDMPFKIVFHSDVGDFAYEDKQIEPTDYLVADEIYERKINAPLKEKRAMMHRAVKAGASYERAVTLCMPLIKKVIDKAKAKVYIAPADAQISFDPVKKPPFTIKRERAGRELDTERAYALVYTAVQKGSGGAYALPIVPVSAEVCADELIARTYLKSSFGTTFSTDNEARAHNIALALSHISGTVIGAGEEFSFNKTVGLRTAANGFKEAKIIKGGDYVLGYGGGVCQASTTLYNAAVRAGMEITMVRNHSLAASYVAPSLDAMVNSGSSDLRFKNPLSTPVYIAAGTDGDRAWVKIYGEKNEYRIVPRSVVLSRTPPPEDEKLIDNELQYFTAGAQSGESMRIKEGKEGIKSEAWLEYYKEGILVRRVKIREDVYMPLRGTTVYAP